MRETTNLLACTDISTKSNKKERKKVMCKVVDIQRQYLSNLVVISDKYLVVISKKYIAVISNKYLLFVLRRGEGGSRMRETKNLSTDMDSSTNTIKVLLSNAKFAHKITFYMMAILHPFLVKVFKSHHYFSPRIPNL